MDLRPQTKGRSLRPQTKWASRLSNNTTEDVAEEKGTSDSAYDALLVKQRKLRPPVLFGKVVVGSTDHQTVSVQELICRRFNGDTKTYSVELSELSNKLAIYLDLQDYLGKEYIMIAESVETKNSDLSYTGWGGVAAGENNNYEDRITKVSADGIRKYSTILVSEVDPESYFLRNTHDVGVISGSSVHVSGEKVPMFVSGTGLIGISQTTITIERGGDNIFLDVGLCRHMDYDSFMKSDACIREIKANGVNRHLRSHILQCEFCEEKVQGEMRKRRLIEGRVKTLSRKEAEDKVSVRLESYSMLCTKKYPGGRFLLVDNGDHDYTTKNYVMSTYTNDAKFDYIGINCDGKYVGTYLEDGMPVYVFSGSKLELVSPMKGLDFCQYGSMAPWYWECTYLDPGVGYEPATLVVSTPYTSGMKYFRTSGREGWFNNCPIVFGGVGNSEWDINHSREIGPKRRLFPANERTARPGLHAFAPFSLSAERARALGNIYTSNPFVMRSHKMLEYPAYAENMKDLCRLPTSIALLVDGEPFSIEGAEICFNPNKVSIFDDNAEMRWREPNDVFKLFSYRDGHVL
jgi:hypothetical protein